MNFSEKTEEFGHFAPANLYKRLFHYVPTATKIHKHYGSLIRRLAQMGIADDRVDLITDQCGRVRLYPKDNASDRWLIKGYPMVDPEELTEILRVMRNLGRQAIIYDIGANAGLYSLNILAATQKYTDIESPVIKAFEPNPTMVTRLQDNLNFNNGDMVEIVPVALSDQNSTVKLDIGKHNNLGEAAVVNDSDAAASGTFISIPALTLTNYINDNNAPSPDIMKLDIEGHEIKVLSAFFQNSPNIRPAIIMCEMWNDSDDDLKDCLAKGGYKFFGKPGDNAIFRHEGSE